VGVQRAHVHQALHALLLARLDDFLGQLDVHAREFRTVGIAPPAVENADQVDDRVAPGYQAQERFRLVHVGLHHVHRGQEDQVLRALAPARGHENDMPFVDELAHDVAADKAAAADDEDPTHG